MGSILTGRQMHDAVEAGIQRRTIESQCMGTAIQKWTFPLVVGT
jgi:hypothetical protein